MSSNPTSDDAKNVPPETDAVRADGTAAEHPGAANYGIPGGAAELGKQPGTPPAGEPPTEVIGGAPYPAGAGGSSDATQVLHDDATQVIHDRGAAQGPPPAEWWQGETAQVGAQNTGPQPTAVLGNHDTEALSPGEAAAYAAGAGSIPGGGQQPPFTPPPTANTGGGQGGSPGNRRSRRTLFVVIGLVLVLVVVGALAGGEAYARNKVGNCISSQFEQQMGSKIDVSFGAKPMLLTMIDNKVGSVTVDSDDTKFGPAVGMTVHATFHDIELQDGGKAGGTIGSSEAQVTWSNDGIVKTLGGLVSAAASDPSAGTLSFTVLGGLAQLQVKPKVVGDKVEVETMSASFLGIGLPTDLVSGIVDLMTQSLQTYPMGLKPTGVAVTQDGLKVSLQGGPTTLQAPDNNGKTQNITC
ncbi:LmeA family phospholipid-binding protein [Nocardia sp. NPDC006630]|uniref:LmeA family phospholipid-binding protein n=1 Tax=Nocardia sp. NPDC006630 TaxID=3157181 RepID=UPI0033BD3C9E